MVGASLLAGTGVAPPVGAEATCKKVVFSEARMKDSWDGVVAYTSEEAISLPAGVVTIPRAKSTDSYSARANVTQTSEIWEAEFLDAQGKVVGRSATTPDLADRLADAMWEGSLGSVTLSAPAVKVRAHHRPDLIPDGSPNSVYAAEIEVCYTASASTSAAPTTAAPTTAGPSSSAPSTAVPTTAPCVETTLPNSSTSAPTSSVAPGSSAAPPTTSHCGTTTTAPTTAAPTTAAPTTSTPKPTTSASVLGSTSIAQTTVPTNVLAATTIPSSSSTSVKSSTSRALAVTGTGQGVLAVGLMLVGAGMVLSGLRRRSGY